MRKLGLQLALSIGVAGCGGDGPIISKCEDVWLRDADGDGFGNPSEFITDCARPEGYVAESDLVDCDDQDNDVHPDAVEVCDGEDNNCDGQTDEGVQVTFYRDEDGDGWGFEGETTEACSLPAGFSEEVGDCDDDQDDTFPGAVEVCDLVDNDCDGLVDDEDDSLDAAEGSTFFLDDDDDGYGDSASPVVACEVPAGAVLNDADCDDANGSVNPDATETCNSIDDDCDGDIDDDDSSLDTSTGSTFYADGDGDGFGDLSSTTLACVQPTGFTSDTTDCDDSVAAVNPGATETCNSIDDDCDGDIDDDDSSLDTSTGSTFYADGDGDGFGDLSSTTLACVQPTGFTTDTTDCDDSVAAVNPGATETCNSIDDDCDGDIDDDDSSLDASSGTVFYRDSDGDGFGDSANTTQACIQPSGFASDSTDCNDSAAAAYPGATEVCDGIDNDCDGLSDDSDSTLDSTTANTWHADVDGDGYGDPDVSALTCVAPTGYLSDDSDCDDTEVFANPGQTEVCDSIDNDCDGLTDDEDGSLDSTSASTWHADLDNDGYGDPSSTTVQCVAPSGYLSDDSDCDDTDALTHPGATELCDDVRNDCDDSSWVDDAGLVSWYDDTTGTWSDISSTWASGTAATPAAIVLSDDGTANICEGTWYTELLLEADVDLVGVGDVTGVILSGGDSSTIVSLVTDNLIVSMANLTLQEGVGTQPLSVETGTSLYGGALFCDAYASLELDTVVFTDNSADLGGAVASAFCDVTASDTTWSLNTAATSAHSAYVYSGSWAETGGIYEQNEAPRAGLYLYGTAVTLSDTTFDANTATEGGGAAIYADDGTDLTGTGLLVTNNQTGATLSGSQFNGGAVWLYSGSTSVITESEFSDNTSDNAAGAVYIEQATVDFVDTLFDGNEAAKDGGAVLIRTSSVVSFDADSTISNNLSDTEGGGVVVFGGAQATFSGTTIDGNLAGTSGGGIYNTATITLIGATVANNLALTSGGGVWNSSAVTATNTNMGGTNTPDDTYAGSDSDVWGTSATFSCTASGCN